MARPWVLLDRDGTLIVERHYLADPAGVELLAGAAQGIKRLKHLGCGVVVVTNQSGIGRGKFTVDQLAAIHQRMLSLLAAEHVTLDGIFFCPHTDDDECDCRKPRVGMALEAARHFDIDLQSSFLVGDKALDVEFGKAAGATTFLVRTGYGAEVERMKGANPDYVVDDLANAALEIESLLAARDRK